MVIFLVPGSVNGLNLYAYCGNNPFMYKQGPALGGLQSLVHLLLEEVLKES